MLYSSKNSAPSQLVVSPGNLLIVGDFNYHLDDTNNLDIVKFNKALESFSLIQHVNGPTRKKGQTLDLIITWAVDELATSIETRCHHSAVHCKLRLKKSPLRLSSRQVATSQSRATLSDSTIELTNNFSRLVWQEDSDHKKRAIQWNDLLYTVLRSKWTAMSCRIHRVQSDVSKRDGQNR